MNLVRVGAIESGFAPIVSSGLKIRLEANDLKSYPESGTQWFNLADASYNATLENGASFNSSNGGSFAFDGTDEYALVADSTTDWQMSASPITLQTWVFFDSLTNSLGGSCGVFGKQSNSYSFDGYSMTVGPSNELRIHTNGTTISKTNSSAHDQIATGAWHMLTAVISLSATEGTILGYKNASLIVSGFHGSDTYNESNSLSLGRGIDRVSGPTFLDGRIGAFYAYDRQLSLTEIENNFNATRRRFGV